MAGLLNKQQQPEGAPPPQDMAQEGTPLAAGAPEDAPANPEEDRPATPEEQEVYDTFVGRGMELLYSERVMPQVLNHISTAPNPVEGAAHALAMLIAKVEDAAGRKGVQLNTDVKDNGALELLERIAELVGPEGANIHEFTDEELSQALAQAAVAYTQARPGGGKPAGAEPPQESEAAPPRRGMIA